MNGYIKGQMVRLRPSITSRPKYFNQSGRMDWMLNGTAFEIHNLDIIGREKYVRVQDGYDYWNVFVDDVVPIVIDNRRIANV